MSAKKPNPVAFTWYGMILAGAAALGSYLLVQKFVFGEAISQRVFITGLICSIALMAGFYVMYRKGEKNKKKNDTSLDK